MKRKYSRMANNEGGSAHDTKDEDPRMTDNEQGRANNTKDEDPRMTDNEQGRANNTKDEDPRMTDNEQGRANNMKDAVLTPIKRYFALTGQHWSFNFENSGNSSKAKRILYGLLQFTIACFVAFYFVYTLGIFGKHNKLYDLNYYFFYYPISTVEHAMWEFRWLITSWLGILLTSQKVRDWLTERNCGPISYPEHARSKVRGGENWLYIFKKNISLSESRWKKVKCLSWTLGALLIIMCAISEVANLWEINFKITRHNALPIFADALFFLLERILAFPLFFLFCVTMHILCCMVEDYRDKIVSWRKDGENESRSENTSEGTSEDMRRDKGVRISEDKGKVTSKAPESENSTISKGENSARERFREIKAAIRIAGLSFESYLMIHFLLLVCTFFLGICACFEQVEVRISENSTMPSPFQIPHYARYINFYGNLTFDTDYTIGAPSTRSASMLTPSYTTSFIQTAVKDATTGANNTLDVIQTKWLKQSMKCVVICMITRTVESLLLYFLPISLMVRLQNRLRRVYEVIEDSNVEEQKEKELLFDDVQVIRRMCKYVKTAHGLKIFGYTVPTFEAFILAAFGPFIAVVIQQLLLHIHMKQ